jgi:hypothetical protein
MKYKILKALVVAVGAASVAAPRGIAAETFVPSTQSAASQPVDVALSHDKLLHGQVVSAQNAPRPGLPVSLVSQGEVVAQATTDASGAFRVPVARGGVYVVSADGAERVVRTWTEQSAPPSAKNGVLVVADETAVRGQAGSWIANNIIPLGIVGGFAGWIISEAASDDESPFGS